ncbi:hypothetical protein BH10ACT2_BH10ACT2_19730 [soil metagenome]
MHGSIHHTTRHTTRHTTSWKASATAVGVVLCLATAACGSDDGSTKTSQVGTTPGTTEATTPPTPPLVASLVVVNGTVELNGQPVEGAAPTDVVDGTTIAVSADGLAQLVLPSTAVIRLGPAATASFQSAGNNAATVALSTGSLWVAAPPDDTTNITADLGGVQLLSQGARLYAGCDVAACFAGTIDGAVQLAGTPLLQNNYVNIASGVPSLPLPFPPSAILAAGFPLQNSLIDVTAGLRPAVADGPASEVGAVLEGAYRVTYETIESDRADLLGGGPIDRPVSIRTECLGLDCKLIFTTELQQPDGSNTTTDTELTFDGTVYRGLDRGLFACGTASGTQVADGLEYTADITVTVTAAEFRDGMPTVVTFETRREELNVITESGKAGDCGLINLTNNSYIVNTVTIGTGVRI